MNCIAHVKKAHGAAITMLITGMTEAISGLLTDYWSNEEWLKVVAVLGGDDLSLYINRLT